MFNDVFIQGNGYISYCFHEYNMTRTCEKCNQKRVIDCLFVISYCFHEYNMTSSCEKCNQKRVIDCLFVISYYQFAYCSTNTVVFESQLIAGRLERWRKAAGKAVLRKNCFLHSQHLLLSRMNMMVSSYCQSLQFLWFYVVVCNPML